MPRDKVDVARRVIDAYNRRDVDLLFAELATPDFEWYPAITGALDGGSGYRGREGVERFAVDTRENWEELQVIAEELRDLGDRVLALGRMKGRGKGSGVPVDQPVANLLDFRGDRIWRSRVYLDRAEALRAADESTTPDLVELMGRAFEAANRGDLDAVASSFAEDASFYGRALGDHFEGRAAIRSFLEDWFATYEELEFGPEEVRDLGNGVVFAAVVQNGRLAGSAGHLRQREGWVFVWVGGLIARLTIAEVDEAHAAAERLARERGR